MTKVSLIAFAGALLVGGMSAQAFAASVAPGDVPYCSGSASQRQIDNGTYAQELQRPGSTLDSLDIWNGCLKAIYTNASGQSRVAFFNPDTLQHIETLHSPG